MENNSDLMHVEVAYALPDTQVILEVRLPRTEAIRRSGILERFPGLDPGGVNKVGIFGKLARMDTMLRERDRVEIYRPLIADPKAIRRQRAAEGKEMKRGGHTPSPE